MPKILLLVATRVEAQRLPAETTVVTGVGAQRAVRALEAAVSERRPDLVVSAGFAGALDPSLRVGDVVRASRVIDEQGGTETVADGDGRTLLSLDRVASVEEKRRLHAATAAHAVDMESLALARRARELGVRFAAIRAISDPADFALPPESERWVGPEGAPRVGEVMRWAGVRPSRIALLLRLKSHADLAGRRLAEAFASVV